MRDTTAYRKRWCRCMRRFLDDRHRRSRWLYSWLMLCRPERPRLIGVDQAAPGGDRSSLVMIIDDPVRDQADAERLQEQVKDWHCRIADENRVAVIKGPWHLESRVSLFDQLPPMPKPGVDRPLVLCVSCRNPVEKARENFAHPVCFACFPPPDPLPVREWRSEYQCEPPRSEEQE